MTKTMGVCLDIRVKQMKSCFCLRVLRNHVLISAVFMLLVWNVRVLKGNSHQGCSATERSHLQPIPCSK